MDRAWEAGGRGGITSLETPLTQRARSSPGGGAQARGAGKAVHAPHKLRAARPPAHVPPSPTQNRALAPRPGGGGASGPPISQSRQPLVPGLPGKHSLCGASSPDRLTRVRLRTAQARQASRPFASGSLGGPGSGTRGGPGSGARAR